jgi:hypothetical protein
VSHSEKMEAIRKQCRAVDRVERKEGRVYEVPYSWRPDHPMGTIAERVTALWAAGYSSNAIALEIGLSNPASIGRRAVLRIVGRW